MSELQQAVINARESWPFEESDEEQYLSDGGFASELHQSGTERELQIYERDGRLIIPSRNCSYSTGRTGGSG